MPDRDVYLSVNLSPRTLESNQFRVGDLKAIFQRNDIPLDRIVLELTEREQVEDLEQLRMNVEACRRAGMRLAADDVGAGNAGLRLLSEIHFDIVKIDLSLVQGGVVQDPSHAVLRALQELAAQWKASIVAEGVETAPQLSMIRSLGVTAGQGYLLGPAGLDDDRGGGRSRPAGGVGRAGPGDARDAEPGCCVADRATTRQPDGTPAGPTTRLEAATPATVPRVTFRGPGRPARRSGPAPRLAAS